MTEQIDISCPWCSKSVVVLRDKENNKWGRWCKKCERWFGRVDGGVIGCHQGQPVIFEEDK